jgi:hypothetical protein
MPWEANGLAEGVAFGAAASDGVALPAVLAPGGGVSTGAEAAAGGVAAQPRESESARGATGAIGARRLAT